MASVHGGGSITLSKIRSGSTGNLSPWFTKCIDNIGATKSLATVLSDLVAQDELLFDEVFYRDLTSDVNDVIDTKYDNIYFYPFCELESASVISLMKAEDLRHDSFAQMLIQSYRY